MSKEKVIRLICDRCGREEFLTEEPQQVLDLVITFLGKTYQYDDLCSKCKAACQGYVDSLVKAKKEKKEEESPPPSPSRPRQPADPSS